MDTQKFDSIWNSKSGNYLSLPGKVNAYNIPWENVTVADKLVQSYGTFKWMLEYAARINPKIVLEIGTGQGVACLFYDELVGHSGLIITINLSDQIDMDVNDIKSEWHRLIMDSSTPEALAAVRDILGDRQVDFLFIDGEHSDDYFTRDYNNYWPLVRKRGVAAFHDCDPGWEIKRTFDRHSGEKELCTAGIAIGAITKS